MNRPSLKRVLAATTAASLLATALFVPLVSAGNSNKVTIGSTTDGVIDTPPTVSAGETTSFPLTVKNVGGQTLNNVTMYFGQDNNPAVEADPQTAITPTAPVNLPDGVTAQAPGCQPIGGGALLTCTINQLKAGKSFTTTVSLTATTAVTAQTINLKAVVFVAEIGNDNGSNIDTFAAEGTGSFVAFSCDSVTAYRPNDKFVQTPCGVAGAQKQQSAVLLPGNLTLITLSQSSTGIVDCPDVNGLSCIGDAVYANITGDTTGDKVNWTLTYNISGLNIHLNKLVVYHYNDVTGALEPAGGISISNKTNCKVTSTNGCAVLNGTTLVITLQTEGNGKVRLLG